jgi:hypothetical protein
VITYDPLNGAIILMEEGSSPSSKRKVRESWI